MNRGEIIVAARNRGIQLSVEDGRIAYRPRSRMAPELLAEIRANRDALLYDVLLADALRYLNERYVVGTDLSVLAAHEDEISAAYLGDWSSYRRAVRGYVQAGLAEFERAKRSAA